MSVDVAEQFGPGGWQFTPAVADVFGEHVRASVPHYDLMQQMIAEIADWLVPAGGRVADLGSATGVTCCAIEHRHPERDIGFDLYDESPAMLKRAELALRELRTGVRVLTHECRIEKGPLSHVAANLTVALFTLQFLPDPADRIRALSLARENAAPGGALIVAEKLRPRDVRWAEIACDASHDWKAARGVTDSAIRAKARALRGVLIPATDAQLSRQITEAGWSLPEPLFRWHQWQMLGAFADGMAGAFVAGA